MCNTSNVSPTFRSQETQGGQGASDSDLAAPVFLDRGPFWNWGTLRNSLVGGFNPIETYDRQIGSFPQVVNGCFWFP